MLRRGRFHGIDPSKNKKAKMQKKFAEEQARLRAATSEAVGGVDRLRHVTAASATPYLVLSGNVKPGQISDPSSGYATSDRAVCAVTARPMPACCPFGHGPICMQMHAELVWSLHRILAIGRHEVGLQGLAAARCCNARLPAAVHAGFIDAGVGRPDSSARRRHDAVGWRPQSGGYAWD